MTPETKAATEVCVSGCSAIFGVAIGTVNDYLQAAAFLVAIISGIAATAYYVKQGRRR